MAKHVIQVYLNEEEYKFLKTYAQSIGKTLAQTLLYLSDFHIRMAEGNKTPDPDEPIYIKGVPVSKDVLDEYEY